MNVSRSTSALIIANGRYPEHAMPLSLIREASFIVCTDGAANDFIARGGVPDAIVGDCDSISQENRERFAAIIHPSADQETNDLTKSVQYCVAEGRKEIVIVGGTGRREDHTLGNISLLAEYCQLAQVVMVTNWGLFTPIAGSTTFQSFRGEQVSIFAIDTVPLTTSGLKYPLQQRVLTNWWQGSLNESTGDNFRIETEGRMIVFQAY
ncbi:thiamine diphosphokinase [Dysgonomonadaceae bacterium zrk40]|nr:thiamine diphosphokinase [Dysgonomonadaceae bacterium zrk40]